MDNIDLQYFFQSQEYITQWGVHLEQLADVQFSTNSRNDIIKKDVYDVFKKNYRGDLKIIPYGSRVTSLATKDSSDFDMLIDTSDSKDPINNLEKENWLLTKVAKHMKEKESTKWNNIKAILSCRTPVLRALHIATQLYCDITVMSHLGVSNTELMCLYIRNTPFLRQVILAVREWSLLYNFDIHNYALSILVLFYMQTEGFIVSVDELTYECNYYTTDITGYDYASYNTIDYDKFQVKPTDGLVLKDLLNGFFEYYSKFDFDCDIVCPLLGHPIKKKLFENKNIKKLPPEMFKYVKKVKEGGEELKIDIDMCVQDPIDLSHNLIKNTKKNFTKMFTNNCLKAAKVLANLN